MKKETAERIVALIIVSIVFAIVRHFFGFEIMVGLGLALLLTDE